jgi:hypothetical protein
MICSRIWVVPPKIAITGVVSVGSRVSGRCLPFITSKEDTAGDQVAGRGSPRVVPRDQIPSAGSESAPVGTAVTHCSIRAVITFR